MKRTILAVLAMGALSCALFSQQAQAVPITGTINLGGAVQFDTNSLATAHAVNVWFDSNGNAGHTTVQPGNEGIFASIPAAGTQADMAQPWIFNPSMPTMHLWSVAGFTFNLMSSTIMTQNASELDIEGHGTVTGPPGFDATTMDWAFSTQSAGGLTHMVFSVSADGTSPGVPDGGATVMLLGAALGALGMARRFLKS